MFQPHALDVGQ